MEHIKNVIRNIATKIKRIMEFTFFFNNEKCREKFSNNKIIIADLLGESNRMLFRNNKMQQQNKNKKYIASIFKTN